MLLWLRMSQHQLCAEGVGIYCQVRNFLCYLITEESSHLWCGAISIVKYSSIYRRCYSGYVCNGISGVLRVSIYCQVRNFLCYLITEESSHLWCGAISIVKYSSIYRRCYSGYVCNSISCLLRVSVFTIRYGTSFITSSQKSQVICGVAPCRSSNTQRYIGRCYCFYL